MTKEELEARVTKLESILAIQNLQAKYGYYLQRGSSANWDELVDLFTDDCTLEIFDTGVYLGKAGVAKTFKGIKPATHSPGLMGIILQLQPYIQVYGYTAKGVWQGLGFIARQQPEPGVGGSEEEKVACWQHCRYENEYRKVDGEWKISKAHVKLVFESPYGAENSWVSHPITRTVQQQHLDRGLPARGYSDRATTEYRPYDPMAKTLEEAMPDPILPPEASIRRAR